MTEMVLPQAFIKKRIHSLMGFWLVLFLIEHLVTNSQAALWLGDSGQGFVRMVNALHNLPYLSFIECTLLGIPLLFHAVLGVQYAYRSKGNAHKTDGSSPSLPKYGRNRAYSLQRITSWILLILLAMHIVKFRFVDYPESIHIGEKTVYFSSMQTDAKLSQLSGKLGLSIYDAAAIEKEKKSAAQRQRKISGKQTYLEAKSSSEYQQALVQKLSSMQLAASQSVIAGDNFGSVVLLKVRETFQSPLYCILYTIFVLSAGFHAFNGFWTFLLSWGCIIRFSTQRAALRWVMGLMTLIIGLGLMAIWGG